MYAIIVDGGRQYRVEEGQEIELDYRDTTDQKEITFERVLAISDDEGFHLGKPSLDGAKVSAEVMGPTRGPKLVIQKFRRRKNSRRKTGHRQLHTKVRIAKISK